MAKKKMTEIRCSSLPRIMACPGSLTLKADVKLDTSGPDAVLGTAAHELYAMAVRSGEPCKAQEIESCAKRYGVDLSRLTFLFWNGWRWWDLVKDSLENIYVEAESKFPNKAAMGQFVGNLEITGHTDVVGNDKDGNLVIIDWKTGMNETSYIDQLYGYFLINWYPKIDKAKLVTVFTGLDGTPVVVEEISYDSLHAWLKRLDDAIESKAFNPGQHCTYCPVASKCKARAAQIKAGASGLYAITEKKEGRIVTVSDLVALRPQRDALKKALDDYDDALKAALIEAGVPQDMGNGKEIFVDERESVRVQLSAQTREELSERWPGVFDRLVSAVEVSKSAIYDADKKNGTEIIAVLEKAGLAKKSTIKVVSTRKAVKENG